MFVDCVGCCYWIDCYRYGQMIDNIVRNEEIKRLRSTGLSFSKIGAVYGLTRQQIHNICNNRKSVHTKDESRIHNLRKQAKIESLEKGVPLAEVYERFGVPYKRECYKQKSYGRK